MVMQAPFPTPQAPIQAPPAPPAPNLTPNNPPSSALGGFNFRSPIDLWSLREFGVPADQLVDDHQQEALLNHLSEQADKDVEHWRPRDERMLESQRFWEIGTRYPKVDDDRVVKNEDKAQTSEVIELPDGYLVVDKITSMGAAAGWSIDVPPRSPQFDDMAQDIEDFLRWGDVELNRRRGMSLHGDTLRDEIFYAALRGWITGMVLPNPGNSKLPWKYVLEDPILVYPRYSQDRLLRVTHRYTVTALEARDEFPDAMDFLLDQDDDEEVEITTYYDDIYKVSFMAGAAGATGSLRSSGAKARILQPLVRHGYKDLDGEPYNPWIIVTPRGTPTRRNSLTKGRNSKSHDSIVRSIGLDVIYPIKGVQEKLERYLSMAATEVAKGVNPPKIWYVAPGSETPEPLDLGEGAENFAILGEHEMKIVESSAMKPDSQPVLQALTDRAQKAGIPDVAFGRTLSGISGYATNMLIQGASDVVDPIMRGVKLFRDLRHRRMLEVYVNGIAEEYLTPVAYQSTDPNTEQVFSGYKKLDPRFIVLNGTSVENKFDTIMPRDAVALMGAALGAVSQGALPLYDFWKDWAGVKDPKQAFRRLAESENLKDPLVKKHLARIAGAETGNELLKQAIDAARQEEQMLMMQQMQMQQAATAGGATPQNTRPPSQSGGAVPTNQQPNPRSGGTPANINPLTAATQQLNNVSASVNAQNGASAPKYSVRDFIQGAA